METNILIVDDEAAIADLVEVYLKNEGYTVHKFGRAGDALACVASTPLDLAILDVMLPDMDGFTLCQKIREAHLFPILMLTARVEDMDKIMGLTLGADDYLIKPFDFDELLARIRAMTRKHAGQRTNRFTAGDLILDVEQRRVTRGGEEVQLLPKEYSILEYLLRNKGKVLSREQIEDRIWNYEYSGSSNNVDGYMSRLRKKIDGSREQKLIHTVKGVGWTVREPEDGGGEG